MECISSTAILLIGVVNPVYSTYRSLRKKTQQTRLEWLRYWVVFGIFYAVTFITDIFLFWIPFYYIIKIVIVFWLASSQASGAQIIYTYALVPLLKDYENDLDRLVTFWRKKISTLFFKCASYLSLKGSSLFFQLVRGSVSISLASPAEGDVNINSSHQVNNIQSDGDNNDDNDGGANTENVGESDDEMQTEENTNGVNRLVPSESQSQNESMDTLSLEAH